MGTVADVSSVSFRRGSAQWTGAAGETYAGSLVADFMSLSDQPVTSAALAESPPSGAAEAELPAGGNKGDILLFRAYSFCFLRRPRGRTLGPNPSRKLTNPGDRSPGFVTNSSAASFRDHPGRDAHETQAP